MKSKEQVREPGGHNSKRNKLRIWSRLQGRMAISYVGVTLVMVLLLELPFLLIAYFLVVLSPLPALVLESMASNAAQTYGQEAALQAKGTALNPRSTFQPGQPFSLTLSGSGISSGMSYFSKSTVLYTATRSSTSQGDTFALLIAPGGTILASSYPALYPSSASIAHELAQQAALIRNALAGRTTSIVEDNVQHPIALAVQPVWSRDNRLIGAVYVQMPLPFSQKHPIPSFGGIWIWTALIWLILIVPLGSAFGIATTWGMGRRIHRLVEATAQFAAGDYTQRVPAKKHDEIGQLEQQFNSMAEQLIASIARQKELIEQQVRVEERARIEQEMLTAQHIQRSLLPREVPVFPDWQFTPYYKPAKEVGGDFYDFLSFSNGQVGIIIGDVSGKGVPAALVMAMTCTMLRTAAQETTAPGEILAKVNDLLSAYIPSGTFVTCFYAVLDLPSGHLRFANAGHDLPYRQHATDVSELRATGMPLGLMPGMHYEEAAVTFSSDESVLFYSDGLVEAHNQQREMFGFPRLMTMLGTHPGDTKLIDFLLRQLAAFTGDSWEQEDDVTMVTLQRTPFKTLEDKK